MRAGEPAPPILVLPDGAPPPFSSPGKEIACNIKHLNAARAWTELGNVGQGAVIVVLENGANHAPTDLRGFWRMMSDYAVAAGLVPVGGTGNFRTTQPIPIQHQSPKNVPSVISVGGIDTLNVLVPFSSMGPAEWSSVALYGDFPMSEGIIKPDLVAYPGAGLPVLGLEDGGYIDTDGVRIRGNSFSGPQAAGIAALILSEYPSINGWRLLEIIETFAHDLGPPGKDNMFGFGLADA